jgi:predicted RNA-binding protein with PIN domain
MFLLIDGYNLLKAIESRLSLTSRDQFIALLVRYLAHKKIEGAVVFDSGPSLMINRQQYGLLQVVYVGQGHSADEYIIEYCRENRSKTFLLVTADRGILRAVAAKNIQAIDPVLFGERVAHSLREKEPEDDMRSALIKKTTDNEPELDQLMTYASLLTVVKKTEEQTERVRQKNRISKKEKKRERLLKKL